MDIIRKLEILSDAAKYDVACTSSGIERGAVKGKLGSTTTAGCCHSFTPDGRCVTLLKVLMTNACAYDCAYCSSRCSNEAPRAAFTPQELADLTIGFYRRNYIEGLFLSSGVLNTPDYTTERMIETFEILRHAYGFRGYIHAKTVPGTSPELIDKMGLLVDRLSVNLELPSQQSLMRLAPQKGREQILLPMRRIAERIAESTEERVLSARKQVYLPTGKCKIDRRGPFAPAGQSTQMIIGASPESDFQILSLSKALYQKLNMKRVFFSAYIPVNDDARLPKTDFVPLDREHRLYQADWLMRFYGFDADELIDQSEPFLDLGVDPKASWALRHLDQFPVEVNSAAYEMLLRVPGIGVKGARRILRARKHATLREDDVRKLGITMKRARYFITCNGAYAGAGVEFSPQGLRACLEKRIDGGAHGRRAGRVLENQLSLFPEQQTFAGELAPRPVYEPGSQSDLGRCVLEARQEPLALEGALGDAVSLAWSQPLGREAVA